MTPLIQTSVTFLDVSWLIQDGNLSKLWTMNTPKNQTAEANTANMLLLENHRTLEFLDMILDILWMDLICL